MEFIKAERGHKGVHAGTHVYFLPQTERCRSRFKLECSMPSLKYLTDDNCHAGVKPACQCDLVIEEVYLKRKPPKCIKVFDEIENAGTEISYRCVDCRNCPE